MRVLVVEDHGDVAAYIADALRDIENHTVDVAADASSAEKLAALSYYDLFIIDLYLGGSEMDPDGLAFAKAVRKARADAKIILMTGKSYSRLITDIVVRSGLAHMLAKPIDLRTLLDAVKTVAGGG